MISLLRKHSEQ